MKARHIPLLAHLALIGAIVVSQLAQAADAPPMGGDYPNVVSIPVNDPSVKAIAGTLIKPDGDGPFPTVVYMPPCGGPNFPLELKQEKLWTERLSAKGVATFIVDPFVARGLEQGNCDKLLTVLQDVRDKNESVLKIIAQGRDDAVAAVKAAKTLPGVDPGKVFLMGFSYGATAALHASDPKGKGAAEVAGVVAYFPLCDEKAEAKVPTLILIGDKDDWTGPVASCEALKGKANFDVVVYPGATHSFDMQFDKPFEFAGHKLAYDPASAKDAMGRVEAFIAAQVK